MPKRITKFSNPRRLVQLLKSIRTEVFKCNTTVMAQRLNRALREHNDLPLTNFTENVVKSIENSNIDIKYIHLETYANLFGVPTGVLLLISRFQHDTPEYVVGVITALSEVILDSCDKREIVHQKHLRLIGQSLSGKSIFDQSFPTQIPTPVDNSLVSALDRLSMLKKRHEKQGTNPLSGLALFDWNDSTEEQ